MKVLRLETLSRIKEEDQFIRIYGLRSLNLWKLSRYAKQLGYKVPRTVLIDSDLSREVNRYHLGLVDSASDPGSYLLPSLEREGKYRDYILSRHKEELLDIASEVGGLKAPIIRGTSCAEGYRGLSFAGICYSAIPKPSISIEDNVINGVARVLASVFSRYAKYYFRVHSIPKYAEDVGLIMMELIDKPIYHVAAYVYPTEIRTKYFYVPTIGTAYHGGGDAVITTDNEQEMISNHFFQYQDVWVHTLSVLRQLPSLINGDNYPVDIEFLISLGDQVCELEIVQIRKISGVHFENYSSSQGATPLVKNNPNVIVIPNSHLFHSVVDYVCEIRSPGDYLSRWGTDLIPTYIIQHEFGEGLFSLLDSLKRDGMSGIGLIVTHPYVRSHDHLQYLVYEDELLRFVVHCDEQLVRKLVYGMFVNIRSNGRETMITPLEKITLGPLHIQFIDATRLPSEQSISAVFLIGFIGDQIIAARNERGWDVPGGHVDSGDSNLLAALYREAREEASVVIEGQVIPFAILQFDGNEKQMLFYTSRDCQLSEFVPTEDAFERSLMQVADFITRYNGDKKVIEILISRALSVLDG